MGEQRETRIATKFVETQQTTIKRITNSPPTEDTMCNNKHQQKQPGQDSSENWQGLYPDLSRMFNQPRQSQNPNRPSMFAVLLGLLGIDTTMYTEPINTQYQPSPSAPPSAPPSARPPASPSAPPPSSGPRGNSHCNCHGNHQPDIMSLLIARALKFSAIFTKGLVVFLAIIMFVTIVSLLPKTLFFNAAFFLLAAGLGLHLPTLVAGHVLYALFTCFDPFFLTLVSIWTIHKTFVRRKPLVDTQFWKRRIAGIHTSC